MLKRKNLTINLGSENGYSVFEILEASKKITKVDIQCKIENPRKGDVAALIASCTLAKNLIGWSQPKSGLEKIIKSTWDIYRNQIKFI